MRLLFIGMCTLYLLKSIIDFLPAPAFKNRSHIFAGRLVLLCILLFLLCGCLMIAMAENYGFLGFTLACAVLCLTMAAVVARQRTGSDDDVHPYSVHAPRTYFFSQSVFPVYRYSPAVADCTYNPVQQDNFYVISVYVMLAIPYFWGVSAVCFHQPVNAGLTVSSLALMVTTVFTLHVRWLVRFPFWMFTSSFILLLHPFSIACLHM